MDKQQQERFAEAVERKKAAAQEASEAPDPGAPDVAGKVTLDATGAAQPGLQTNDRSSQDTFSVRDKNSGHGKKTADKWNQ